MGVSISADDGAGCMMGMKFRAKIAEEEGQGRRTLGILLDGMVAGALTAGGFGVGIV